MHFLRIFSRVEESPSNSSDSSYPSSSTSPTIEERLSSSSTTSSSLTSRPHHITSRDFELGELNFAAGAPIAEAIEGHLHLFKDIQKFNETKAVSSVWRNQLPDQRTQIVAVVAIPTTTFAIQEFCKSIAAYHSAISKLSFVRDLSTPNWYMSILTFVDQLSADQFWLEYNGTTFGTNGALEAHVVFLRTVEVYQEADCKEPHHKGTEKVAIELPLCPVCLDRIDSAESGILTTKCNHWLLKCKCHTYWESSQHCTVCKLFSKDKEKLDKNTSTSASVSLVSSALCCTVCSDTTSAWICLICGNVGCGRFTNRHAEQHFETTRHAYSLELETQRIWDYAGDNYVHRLTHSSGTPVVELPDSTVVTSEGDMETSIAKLEWEYNYLLTSQLEEQRKFFEGRIAQLEKSSSERIAALELEKDIHSTCGQVIPQLENQSDKLEKKKSEVEKEIGSLRNEKKFLEQFNRSLIEDHRAWKSKLEAAETSVAEKTHHIAELEKRFQTLCESIEAEKQAPSSPNLSDSR